MKLRNKKTGEIKEYTHTMTSYHVPIKGGYEIFTPWKPEEWEELEDAKEPLIKDEKVRKAVRAWAEANGIDHIVSYILEDGIEFAGNATRLNIRFEQPLVIDTDRIYSITELCGEEEQ